MSKTPWTRRPPIRVTLEMYRAMRAKQVSVSPKEPFDISARTSAVIIKFPQPNHGNR